MPETVHFASPVKLRDGSTQTRILSHDTSSSPYLLLTETGAQGFKKLILSDPPLQFPSDFFLIFKHIKTDVMATKATWVVEGTTSDNQPIACPNLTVEMNSKKGRFANPFAPGFLYEWHATGAHLTLKRWSNKSSRMSIAKLTLDATGAHLCPAGKLDQHDRIWKSREECAFLVGTAVATLLVDMEPVDAGNAAVSCSIMHKIQLYDLSPSYHQIEIPATILTVLALLHTLTRPVKWKNGVFTGPTLSAAMIPCVQDSIPE
ncbi:hypothetical protein HDU98_006210 [Podochytrium sp. JEL0797]|nr:hypothetical protein HDU98_006210 [Podochytrium sp. JEL0797]